MKPAGLVHQPPYLSSSPPSGLQTDRVAKTSSKTASTNATTLGNNSNGNGTCLQKPPPPTATMGQPGGREDLASDLNRLMESIRSEVLEMMEESIQKAASFCASLCAERIVAARRDLQRRLLEERRTQDRKGKGDAGLSGHNGLNGNQGLSGSSSYSSLRQATPATGENDVDMKATQVDEFASKGMFFGRQAGHPAQPSNSINGSLTSSRLREGGGGSGSYPRSDGLGGFGANGNSNSSSHLHSSAARPNSHTNSDPPTTNGGGGTRGLAPSSPASLLASNTRWKGKPITASPADSTSRLLFQSSPATMSTSSWMGENPDGPASRSSQKSRQLGTYSSCFTDAYDAVQNLEEQTSMATRAMDLLDEALAAAAEATGDGQSSRALPIPRRTARPVSPPPPPPAPGIGEEGKTIRSCERSLTIPGTTAAASHSTSVQSKESNARSASPPPPLAPSSSSSSAPAPMAATAAAPAAGVAGVAASGGTTAAANDAAAKAAAGGGAAASASSAPPLPPPPPPAEPTQLGQTQIITQKVAASDASIVSGSPIVGPFPGPSPTPSAGLAAGTLSQAIFLGAQALPNGSPTTVRTLKHADADGQARGSPESFLLSRSPSPPKHTIGH